MNDAQPGPSDYTTDSPRPSDISSGKRPDTHPQNLRFQRRTSERAYYEGSYREGPPTPRMDYSAVNTSSPWASSPEASRQTFSDANVSRESLPPPAVSHPGSEDNNERPSSGWEQDQPKQWQPQNEAHAHQQQQQDHQADRQRHGEPEIRRPQSAARYHGAAPHPAQQRQPQYKLQTKITGLERTGKKDAILRFDVYVCNHPTPNRAAPCLQSLRQTFPNSEQLNSATSAVLIPNSRSYVPTCKPPTQRHWSLQYHHHSLQLAWAQTRTKLAQKLTCSAGSATSVLTKFS
jgi:hypothetical protein